MQVEICQLKIVAIQGFSEVFDILLTACSIALHVERQILDGTEAERCRGRRLDQASEGRRLLLFILIGAALRRERSGYHSIRSVLSHEL